MDEGWIPTSDGVLQIIVSSKDSDLITFYAISKSINGSISYDADSLIYGLQRKGMIFEVSSVSIKKKEYSTKRQ